VYHELALAPGEAFCGRSPDAVAMKGEMQWGKRIWNSFLDCAVKWLS
jgi:hypothetical protein